MIGLMYSALIVFIMYVGCVCLMYGVPPSISESFYLLRKGYKGMNRDFSYSFTFFCYAVCFGILPVWIHVTPDHLRVIPFVSAASLCFVGAAPLFKTVQRTIHFTAAILCMVMAILWIFLSTSVWFIPLLFVLPLIPSLIMDRKRIMFWVEIWSFVSLFTSLLLTVLSKSHLF